MLKVVDPNKNDNVGEVVNSNPESSDVSVKTKKTEKSCSYDFSENDVSKNCKSSNILNLLPIIVELHKEIL